MTAFPHPFPYGRFILVFFLRRRSLEPLKFLGLLPHEVGRCAPPPLSRVPTASNGRPGGNTRIGRANVPVAAHSPLYAHDPGAALARRFAQPRHFFGLLPLVSTAFLAYRCIPVHGHPNHIATPNTILVNWRTPGGESCTRGRNRPR